MNRQQVFETHLARYRSYLSVPWDDFIQACLRPLPTTGWIHPSRPGFAVLAERDRLSYEHLAWRTNGVRLDAGPPPSQLLTYRAGLLHLQEEASMIPVQLLGPKPGERILDLCAAPGNKAAELAAALAPAFPQAPQGCLVANDISAGRLNITRTTRDRLGLPQMAITQVDGGAGGWPDDHFDAVLVDAPCSCEGTLRRYPRAASRTFANHRTRLAATQTKLLLNALRTVRPGGRVVYSTCTFAPEENESVVLAALTAMPDVSIEPARLPGLQHAQGLTSWETEGGAVEHCSALQGAIRLWPGMTDTGGFFAVILRKEGGVAPEPSPLPGPLPAVDSAHAHRHSIPEITSFLTDLFGLPRDWAEPWEFRLRGKSMDMMPRRWATMPDEGPGVPHLVDERGFSLVRINRRVPKLTTQGALFLGRSATRQVAVLSETQIWAFMRGEGTRPENPAQLEFGFVIVECDEVPLGVGLFRPDSGVLESQYPAHWGGLERPKPS